MELKWIKYIICLFVFVVIATINGDMFNEYLFQLGAQLSSSYYSLTDSELNGGFFSDVSDSAQRHGVFAYFIDANLASSSEQRIEIFCSSPEAQEYFAKRFEVSEKYYPSLFFASSTVQFCELSQCSYNSNINDLVAVQFFGEPTAQKAFISELASTYRCTETVDSSNLSPSASENGFLLIALWAVPIALMLIISGYEVLLGRREACVRRSLGERAIKIFAKNALLDGAAFSLIFAAVFGLLSHFTNTFFLWRTSLVMLAVLVISNAAVFLGIFAFDLRKAFARPGESASLLTASYLLKLLTSLLTVLLISTSLSQLSELTTYGQREDFFKKYQGFSCKEFCFAQRTYDDPTGADPATMMKYLLYRKLFASGNAVLQSCFGRLCLPGENKYDMVVFNRNARENLTEYFNFIPESRFNKEKIYFFIPTQGLNASEIKIMKDQVLSLANGSGFFFSYKCETEFIEYNSDVTTLVLSNSSDEQGGRLVKNPVVAFSNLREDVLPLLDKNSNPIVNNLADGSVEVLARNLIPCSYIENIMYRISDTQLAEFTDDFGFSLENDYYMNDGVYETFERSYSSLRRTSAMAGAASALMTLLELLVICSVVKIEYSVNATLLAVKTILGYSIWQKNKKILFVTFFVLFISSAGAVCVSALFHIGNAIFVLAGCAALIFFELASILYFIRKIESMRIIKILNGGSL